MSADLSFFSLIAGASVVVQLVMLLLLTVSVLSWAMIFRKRSALHQARTDADRFEERFWSGGDLYSLYNQISPRSENLRGLANIFVAGFQEFTRLEPGRARGQGLGLSIVHRILDAYDCYLDVDSHLGDGTTFILRLHQTTSPKRDARRPSSA